MFDTRAEAPIALHKKKHSEHSTRKQELKTRNCYGEKIAIKILKIASRWPTKVLSFITRDRTLSDHSNRDLKSFQMFFWHTKILTLSMTFFTFLSQSKNYKSNFRSRWNQIEIFFRIFIVQARTFIASNLFKLMMSSSVKRETKVHFYASMLDKWVYEWSWCEW